MPLLQYPEKKRVDILALSDSPNWDELANAMGINSYVDIYKIDKNNQLSWYFLGVVEGNNVYHGKLNGLNYDVALTIGAYFFKEGLKIKEKGNQ